MTATEEGWEKGLKEPSLKLKDGRVRVGERDYAFTLALIIVSVFVALVALQRFEAAAVLGPFVGQAWDRYFRRREARRR